MRGIETLMREGSEPRKDPLANTVSCLCGRTLWLQRERSPHKNMRFFGGVCLCGRGADLFIEKKPGNGRRR